MGHESEPGSKDALYDEIRRRILRNQSHDRIDRYDETMGGVRASVAHASDGAGALLGSNIAVWLAGALTVAFAAAAIFIVLNPEWNPVSTGTDHLIESPGGDLAFDGD